MAAASILAPGTSTATSTDVVVATPGKATVGLYVAAGDIPNCSLRVMQATPGADINVGTLDRSTPVLMLDRPGTYRVVRAPNTDWAQQVGVFSDA